MSSFRSLTRGPHRYAAAVLPRLCLFTIYFPRPIVLQESNAKECRDENDEAVDAGGDGAASATRGAVGRRRTSVGGRARSAALAGHADTSRARRGRAGGKGESGDAAREGTGNCGGIRVDTVQVGNGRSRLGAVRGNGGCAEELIRMSTGCWRVDGPDVV